MMKLFLTSLAIIGSSSAFAPAQKASKSTALSYSNMQFQNEIGAMTPLGLWDPLNVLNGKDQKQFDRLRAQEIKHGRVAMLAVVGYLVTYAGVRFPGLESMPSGWAVWEALPQEVNGQLAATVILMEFFNRDAWGKAEFPSDFRNGFLDFGWDKQSDDWKLKKRTLELNQGRAAQMGILGLMVHDYMGNVDEILPWQG